ncbi:TetR/AcrR family transcriptional regulator [Massilia antarctica]|uniref:TetR/AcrR family transcriptional regulator n=1 Tax=Massilia antarctica TaxID=2765360 RepID=UPI0006BB7025|nr:TetR-like C-terminal domain-containing protein [Massilia sp. H27-R4]MCY0910693.1 TetR/AcrR family transcriptional regulator [Massilia sp. H27-R4]CUI08934.1 Transcriptional regulator, TetR family [Janthinobacterium sp. CG23_2]CUU32720.1 Transcriptional regulator, TetR family [Janthinobacterium sp. CG23_2]
MSTLNRSTYHHGDLRAALLAAAEDLVDETGAGAISLREVARRAGVSATACYRHFEDKEALLAALAAKGYADFALYIEQAAGGAPDALAAVGQAYVRFALERPGRFRLMYGPLIADRSRHPGLQAAVQGVTQAFARMLQGSGGEGKDVGVMSLKLWCMVHGLAQLLLDGMLPGHDPEVLARALTTR